MKKTTTVDLRTIKTKKLILDTFQQMLTEMDLDVITIKALAERAGINRKTFYSHYSSIDELYDAVVADLVVGFRTVLATDEHRDFIDTISSLYDYACELPVWSRNLLSCSDLGFARILTEQIFLNHKPSIKNPTTTEDAIHCLKYQYIISSFTALYKAWAQYGDLIGKEQFINIAAGLITFGEGYVK